MKLRRLPLPLSLLLLQSLSLTGAIDSPPKNGHPSLEHVSSLAEGRGGADIPIIPSKSSQNLESISSSSSSWSSTSIAKPTAASFGTKDAPVDGKDGRPHEGPFVETAAQRDRKKAMESGEDEAPKSGKKPAPKDLSPGTSHEEGRNKPDMPVSNDGVMDDPHRVGPKEGTRGTEGGISEKDRDKKSQASLGGMKPDILPEKPKEVPPLPHSEQEKVPIQEGKDAMKSEKGGDEKAKVKDEKLKGLTKPDDLPDKPHDIPHPTPVGYSKENSLKVKKPGNPTTRKASAESVGLIQPLHSFLLSFTMIIFSEIGDKTFLIAALMAMKHPPLFVFSAAFPALIIMTILSAVLGHAVPSLIPERFTNFAAALLFLVFGLKMLKEGYAIKAHEGVGEEMKEVEMELEEKEQLAIKMGRRRSSITPYMLESGRMSSRKSRPSSRLPAPPASPPSSQDSRSPSPSRGSTVNGFLSGVNNLFSLLLSPAWVQTFVMTFLGEWGDRSQIATIAMAAGQDYWWVTGGVLLGHAICLAVAVIGGRAIAGRVSLRIVTLGGAIAFLVFGVIYLVEALFYK